MNYILNIINMSETTQLELIPRHVSIIMDGNGRWAKERGLERIQGHIAGVESVRAVLEESLNLGIEYLSIYAFSEENWGRPEKEVNFLMGLFVESLKKELDNFMRNGVKVRILGHKERLSAQVLKAIDEVENLPCERVKTTMVIFLSYSGKWDILSAAKALALKAANGEISASELEKLDFDGFASYMVTAGIPDPDLIIRTSGERRLSNYLLYQAAYSEFYFTETLWPDFRKEAYLEALRDFAGRHRRYGKL